MIELQDVHKTYDTGTKALNGISCLLYTSDAADEL